MGQQLTSRRPPSFISVANDCNMQHARYNGVVVGVGQLTKQLY